MPRPPAVPCPHTKEEWEILQTKIAEDQSALDVEIGKFVRMWGLLHERFGNLFAGNTGIPIYVAYSIWHTIKSDFTQREILSAALVAKLNFLRHGDSSANKLRIKYLEEILWTVQKTTEIAVKRNDIIHSAIVFEIQGSDYEAKMDTWSGSQRAARYKDVDLYQFCAAHSAFIEDLMTHLARVGNQWHQNVPFPERPRLRPFSQFPTRKKRPSKKSEQ